MVLDIVAANEKERLKHAHSLRVLQESNDRFAEQLQQMSSGFLQAMAKLNDVFGDVSTAGTAPNRHGLAISPCVNGSARTPPGVVSRLPVDVGAERLLAIKEAVGSDRCSTQPTAMHRLLMLLCLHHIGNYSHCCAHGYIVATRYRRQHMARV